MCIESKQQLNTPTSSIMLRQDEMMTQMSQGLGSSQGLVLTAAYIPSIGFDGEEICREPVRICT